MFDWWRIRSLFKSFSFRNDIQTWKIIKLIRNSSTDIIYQISSILIIINIYLISSLLIAKIIALLQFSWIIKNIINVNILLRYFTVFVFVSTFIIKFLLTSIPTLCNVTLTFEVFAFEDVCCHPHFSQFLSLWGAIVRIIHTSTFCYLMKCLGNTLLFV